MHLFVCLAGFSQEVLQEISKRPARFTGNKNISPIATPISPPFFYRQGMENYYHQKLSLKIREAGHGDDVGVIVAYSNYSQSEHFVSRFFPFALVAPIEPFYYNACPANSRRSDLLKFVDRAELIVRDLRSRAAVMRDHLSGQNFSPLTLPIRNFKSSNLQERLKTLFTLSGAGDARSAIQDVTHALIQQHPLKKDAGHRPYFVDERGLRFKSPGKDRHGWNRGGNFGHRPECHINSRVRLGAPLRANFHYDCDHERRKMDTTYPNCHGMLHTPTKHTHVNIAPNDAIR